MRKIWIPKWTFHDGIYSELKEHNIHGVVLYYEIKKKDVNKFQSEGFVTYESVPCFHSGNPDNETDYERALERVEEAVNKGVDGVYLDIIRYLNPHWNHIFGNKSIIRFCRQAQMTAGKLVMTNVMFNIPLLYGQNPLQMREFGTLAPMFYNRDNEPKMSPSVIWLVTRLYRLFKCITEPVIGYYNTNTGIVARQIQAIGKCDYSLFRYGKDIEGWKWCDV
jgi:hypothetical protein